MTRAIVLTLAVCTALAWAVPSDPTTAPPGLTRAATYVPDGPNDDEIAPAGTSRPASPADVDWATVGGPGREIIEDEATIPLTPFIDWGDDKLIAELSSLPTHGKISSDVAPNGDIYVAVLAKTSGQDTIHHFRSTNGGLDWETLTHTRADTIKDFVLRIGSNAGGVWMYTFVIQGDGLVVRRIRPDGSNWNWAWIVATDTIRRVTADRNIETPQHLFCAWETDGGRIVMESSSDSAQTWGNRRFVSSDRQRPSLAAGGGGHVYLTYLNRADSTEYRVARYNNNLIAPTPVFNTIGANASNRHLDVSVAAARTTPVGSQTAILLSTCKWQPNDNDRALYAWTTDGGVNWTDGTTAWPPTNIARETWRARGPYIRNPYSSPNFRAVVTMPEATTSFDSIVYAMSTPANPDNWTQRDVHNDFRVTGEYGAQVDNSSQTSGGFIVYRQWASRNIWFDGFNWTGVEEDGSPVQVADPVTLPFGRNEVRLNLDRPGTVRAVLYDGSGREVAKLHDGTLDAGEHRLPVATGSLARGIYFANVDIGGTRHTAKLLIAD